MNLIAAVDNKWGIGKKNDLLFHLKKDMEFFKLVKNIELKNSKLVAFGSTRKSNLSVENDINLNPKNVIVVDSIVNRKGKRKRLRYHFVRYYVA